MRLLDIHSLYWGWLEIVINHNVYYVQEKQGTYIPFKYLQYYKMKNEKVDDLSILQWDQYLRLVIIVTPIWIRKQSQSQSNLNPR